MGPDVRIVVNIRDGMDQFDNQLGYFLAGSGPATYDECAWGNVRAGVALDAFAECQDVPDI